MAHISPTTPTRRTLLRAGALAAALPVAGCQWLSTNPTSEKGTTGGSTGAQPKGHESPLLAKQVKSGDLPPVKKRLPAEPVRLQPVEQAGNYGGEWRNALLGTANSAYIYCLCGYENLLEWTEHYTGKAGTSEIRENIASKYEANADATEFTFWLRPGMRWSDGEPFTVRDVMFGIEDVLMDKDISPDITSLLTTPAGDPAKVEQLDDNSFKFVFPAPSGMFLQRVASPDGFVLTHYPFHYLKQFHKKYNPNVEELVKKEHQQDWITLFGNKAATWAWGQNPELPSLYAWRLVKPYGKGQEVVLERSPYYWKVDSEGSQLPYIDTVSFKVVNDAEVMLLSAMSGDLNLEVGPDTRFTSLKNKPVLARNRSKGHYRFLKASESRMNVMIVFLNLSHKHPVKREIFNNKDFRIGLSYAMDRKEMIKTTMLGLGAPYQVAPLPDSPFYDETFATQYLEHDEAKANEFLDKAYPKKGSDGLRLGPDGKPIIINLEFVPNFRPEWTDMLDLLHGYWGKVGVKLNLKSEDRSLWQERMSADTHDATVWHGDGGLEVLLGPGNYFPTDSGTLFAPFWGEWYTSHGDTGMRPPDPIRQQMKLYDSLLESADPAKQSDLMRQILAISRDEFWVMGVAREVQKYFIVGDQFRNLPQPMLQSWIYPTPGPTQTSQYFMRPA